MATAALTQLIVRGIIRGLLSGIDFMMITTGLRKLLHRTPWVQTVDCGLECPDKTVAGYKEIIERLNSYCGA